ncbi:MAG TPA: PH domain-containing protein [Acidimicrobiia bacterium]|jgi:hypothetical protein
MSPTTQPDPSLVRFPESRLRVALSLLTPPSMLLMAWGAWVIGAAWPVTVLLGLFALFLGYVVVFDFTTAVEISDTGLTRVSLLRRHVMRWEDLAAIVRPRKRGIIAVGKDHKRHILIDRRLDDDELATLHQRAESKEVRVEL